MKLNRQLSKKIIESVEFFYDHVYKRGELEQLEVLGDHRLLDIFKRQEMAEEENFAPKPFEDLVEPQIVAVSKIQEDELYVVVFGVGASYVVEAPDMSGGSFTKNAFALVDMSGRRPKVEKFIVGRENETKIKLLKKHLVADYFKHFNDRALKKDHSSETLLSR